MMILCGERERERADCVICFKFRHHFQMLLKEMGEEKNKYGTALRSRLEGKWQRVGVKLGLCRSGQENIPSRMEKSVLNRSQVQVMAYWLSKK